MKKNAGCSPGNVVLSIHKGQTHEYLNEKKNTIFFSLY